MSTGKKLLKNHKKTAIHLKAMHFSHFPVDNRQMPEIPLNKAFPQLFPTVSPEIKAPGRNNLPGVADVIICGACEIPTESGRIDF